MAFKINGTTIFNDSGNIDWSLFTDRPSYVTTLTKITVGDGSNFSVPATNAAFSGTTITLWFDTNCNCVCGDGGDGGGDGG